jgi:phage virion morphogenesis protein
VSGAVLAVDVEALNLEAVDTRIGRLAFLDLRQLLEGIGAEVESQTRRRIVDEKTDPDGNEWAPWSPKYSETRHQGQSLLENQGHLLDSLMHEVQGTDVLVGSNLAYAATHQYGDPERSIPARPYLGLSAENEADIVRMTVDFLDETLK